MIVGFNGASLSHRCSIEPTSPSTADITGCRSSGYRGETNDSHSSAMSYKLNQGTNRPWIGASPGLTRPFGRQLIRQVRHITSPRHSALFSMICRPNLPLDVIPCHPVRAKIGTRNRYQGVAPRRGQDASDFLAYRRRSIASPALGAAPLMSYLTRPKTARTVEAATGRLTRGDVTSWPCFVRSS